MNLGSKTMRQEIVDEAREWLGTKFVHQARIKGMGCDCVGLIIGVGINTGVLDVNMNSMEVRKFMGYSKRPDPRMILLALRTFMVPVRKNEAGAGDVVYRSYEVEPQHLGILTGPFKEMKSGVVHALRWPNRKVIENRTDEDWYQNVVSAWRYPGMVI